MENLFDAGDRARILERLAALRADAPRAWGTMDPAQALTHCALALEACTGDRPMKQILMGRLLAPFFRGLMLGPKPFSRNAPTGRDLVIRDPRDFEAERRRVAALVEKMAAQGPESAGRFPHGFLGRLTGAEWGRAQWKHLDHHLRQFGA